MSYVRMNKEAMAQRVAADIFPGAYVNLGIGLPTLVGNCDAGHLRATCRGGSTPGVMMSYVRMNKEAMAQRVAADIFPGAYVNLGIGLPTLVGNYIDPGKHVMLHSENGLLGMGPAPAADEEDPDLINAGKQPVTTVPGAAFFHHGDSFVMMRGGHLDICVLGAYQVAQNGDLANWHTGDPDAIPAVGGAMDLAVGARNVWVMTTHTTRDGQPKLMRSCSYPLTGLGCVKRVYTDLCVIEIHDGTMHVREMVDGLSFEALQALTDAPLHRPTLSASSTRSAR